MKVRTISYSEPKVGDKISTDGTIFRDGVELFICHIEGELIYFSWDKSATKGECETSFAEDATILRYED